MKFDGLSATDRDWLEKEQRLDEDLRAEKWGGSPTDADDERFLLERRSCRLPDAQRLSEATRVGRCRMLGIPPFAFEDTPYLMPRPAAQEPDRVDERRAA